MAAFYEPGKYRVRVTKQQFGENKNSNPELQLAIKPIGIYEGEEPSDMEGLYDRTIFLTLTEGTLGTAEKPGWVMTTLLFLGFNGTSFAQLDPEHTKAISFVGKEFDARCDVEEYQGKEREKWNVLRPGTGSGGPATKPIATKAVRALDAKFGKLLKSSIGRPAPNSPADPESTAAAIATMDPPPPGRAEEDIPF